MSSDLYWVSALVYAVVLLFIHFTDSYTVKNPGRVEKSYRIMVGWTILFCLQDMMWGICAKGIIANDKVFFISSSIFHCSTVLTTYFWLKYILDYLGDRVRRKKLYLWFDIIIIASEFIIVGMNFFKPLLFSIKEGNYVTEFLRPITFINQYLVYVIIGITALVCAAKEAASEKMRFLSVFYFALAPIALGIFQLLYPDGPYYSLGYFLGCFIAHIYVVSKDREAARKNAIFKPIAEIYYTMHIIDLTDNSVKILVDTDNVKSLYGDTNDAQDMLNNVMRGTINDEYLDLILEFVNLSTLPERLADNKSISCEVVGRNYGWTCVSFFPSTFTDGILTSVMMTTRVIDAEKRKQIDLIYKSHNDEMTGLYNRRAYVEDMMKYKDGGLEDDFAYLSLDVNGLKIVNDSLGHTAGDELLTGAATVLKKVFSEYGKIYRTGGDEFTVIFHADEKEIEILKEKLEDGVNDWKGELVDRLYVSCGYVSKAEMGDMTAHDITVLADSRMYEAKNAFYREKGIDRRGQKDAHIALCALYTKILKINLTKDTYQILNMSEEEKSEDKGFSDSITTWLADFADKGLVHPDDLEEYLSKTNVSYMKKFFERNKTSLTVFYRRKIGEDYKRVMMEIIPANDYTHENQSLYLYVKCIDK